jgi:hypothetical protein
MIAMRMMQVSVDEVIGVIAMRHGGMAAASSVRVVGGFFVGPVSGRALRRIGGTDGNDVFMGVGTMAVMQMSAVEVVRMPLVDNGQVATTGSVLMRMGVGVFAMGGTTAGDESQRQDE